MKLNNFRDKRGNIVTEEPMYVIIMILVIAVILIFLFRVNIVNLLKNLPTFKISGEEKVGDKEADISGQGDEEVEEAKKQCIYDAFWSKNLVKIKKGSEINPGTIELTLKIGNIENCRHRITISKNIGASEESMDINKDILTKTLWKNQGEFYYIDYNAEDKGIGRSGKYSFAIFDSAGNKVLDDYEIIVES